MPRTQALATAVIVTALAILLRAFPPDHFSFYPSCPFHALTGFLCPGCGGTRALAALVAGRWSDAVHLNALIAMGLPLFVLRLLWVSTAPNSPIIPRRLVTALLIIAALFAVARNIVV